MANTTTLTRASTFQDRILQASTQNKSLLATLSQTDYAQSALQQNAAYINDLTRSIRNSEQNLASLSKVVADEFKDHKKYRDSTMRRLAFKIGRKSEEFNSKAEKEEREYFEAVEAEFKAKRDLEGLLKAMAEATTTKKELENDVAINKRTQQELDSLYASIFDGPTPEIVGEDTKEVEVSEAQPKYHAIMLRLSTEQRTHSILNDAQKFMRRAMNDIDQALGASKLDMWGVGGTFADMQERSALSLAQNHCSQVEMLVSQAKCMQPLVNTLPHIQIAQGHLISDVIFDNIFSDLDFHDKILGSKKQLIVAQKALAKEVGRSQQRMEVVKREGKYAGEVLSEKRRELQTIRAEAFEKIAGGLPDYEP